MQLLGEGALSEIVVSVAAAFVVAILALGPKVVSWVIKRWRAARIEKYISATSFAESEILSSLQGYVNPRASSSDPAISSEMKDFELEGNVSLFRYVDRFIESGSTKYLFVLADCGMGKTSFLINYFHNNRARLIPSRILEMKLVILSRGSAKAEVEAVPSDKRSSVVLLLDALDEDPYVFDDPVRRVREIFEISEGFKAVIISCRSQFFESDAEIPLLSGISRLGPTKLGESKEYGVEKIYIAPFDDRDIRKYLRRKIPGIFAYRKRKRARDMIRQVPYLAVRPMLLNHITEVMSEQVSISSQSDIYQAMVSAWVKREDRWVKQKPLLEFSRLLAMDLYMNRENRGAELCSRDEIAALAGDWSIDIKTEYLTGRSLLNRTAEGGVKFSHRSILEYFVAQSVTMAPAGLVMQLTDQMTSFLLESLGCADGFTEFYLSRSASMQVKVVSPEVRAGFSTNYMLYQPGEFLAASGVYGMRCEAGKESSVWGEYVALALACAVRAGAERFMEVRLHIPARGELEYAPAFMSMWFENLAVVGRLALNSVDLGSACGLEDDRFREIVLVSNAVPKVESMSWRVQRRFSFANSRLIKLSSLERNPCLGVEHEWSSQGVVMKIIAGGHVGALSEFGIVSGGSAYLLERQQFVVMRRARVETLDVGRQIDSEKPKIPVSERWPAGRGVH